MLVVSALLNVASVGKPRKPTTGGQMAVTLVLTTPLIGYIAWSLFR
jgi:hypothetical protein